MCCGLVLTLLARQSLNIRPPHQSSPQQPSVIATWFELEWIGHLRLTIKQRHPLHNFRRPLNYSLPLIRPQYCSHSVSEARKPHDSALAHPRTSPDNSGRRLGEASLHRSARGRRGLLGFHCRFNKRKNIRCCLQWPCLPSVYLRWYVGL